MRRSGLFSASTPACPVGGSSTLHVGSLVVEEERPGRAGSWSWRGPAGHQNVSIRRAEVVVVGYPKAVRSRTQERQAGRRRRRGR
jgi:hypothetical protein